MAARAGTALAGTALAGRRKWRAKAFLQRASEAFLQAGTVWKALPVEEANLKSGDGSAGVCRPWRDAAPGGPPPDTLEHRRAATGLSRVVALPSPLPKRHRSSRQFQCVCRRTPQKNTTGKAGPRASRQTVETCCRPCTQARWTDKEGTNGCRARQTGSVTGSLDAGIVARQSDGHVQTLAGSVPQRTTAGGRPKATTQSQLQDGAWGAGPVDPPSRDCISGTSYEISHTLRPPTCNSPTHTHSALPEEKRGL
eukprot:CAMPEP_0117683362 /NCGR_PEP_ID=MMETSP0804-20121206/20344_1 /TAXON_ID=1074897 /ORGANISM="Tetraselmis astigmatica, Strain CCMP880" /LENGTH=252 /DNA_ID=CAMNT_0005493919 /DNA_START=467 /DNA_END=1226 /DNA_ORIENTATION=-